MWIPNALPSFVLTFVDSEAGNTMWAAETVSTSDATRYTAGASITVVETESGVSFTKHVRSEYTASPTSRILTEQQLFSSRLMEFENKEHFTLTCQIAGAKSRNNTFTVMTNLNWPELEACPPTPAPTPVPAQVTPSGEKDKGGNDVTGAALFLVAPHFFAFCPVGQLAQHVARSESVRGAPYQSQLSLIVAHAQDTLQTQRAQHGSGALVAKAHFRRDCGNPCFTNPGTH